MPGVASHSVPFGQLSLLVVDPEVLDYACACIC